MGIESGQRLNGPSLESLRSVSWVQMVLTLKGCDDACSSNGKPVHTASSGRGRTHYATFSLAVLVLLP